MKPFRALSICIILTIAGCAGANVTPGSSVANPASQSATSGLGSAALVPGNVGPAPINHRAPAVRVKPDKASYQRALYVGDCATASIKILSNTYYHELGVITNGITCPFAESIDQQGNLYVANNEGLFEGDVLEYAPGGTSPSFTYSANMGQPYAVTVDRHGNVYEAGDESASSLTINEYFQKFNTPIKSCPVPGNQIPFGLAVDTSGDVFVSGDHALYEFSGGLGNCNPTLLMSLEYMAPQGMVLDSNNDLLLGDGFYGGAYVIAPPYSAVTSIIGAAPGQATSLSLNKKNKLLFIASGFTDVLVYNYQTGALVKTLDSTYGISNSQSVVDAPNAVY